MLDYKLNLQLTFAHQNIGVLDHDAKVLLKFIKNNSSEKIEKNNIFEIEEKDLDNIIVKLKEVYSKIKI